MMDRATEILGDRRDELVRLAEALSERRRLSGDDVREFIVRQPRLRLVQPWCGLGSAAPVSRTCSSPLPPALRLTPLTIRPSLLTKGALPTALRGGS